LDQDFLILEIFNLYKKIGTIIRQKEALQASLL